MKIFGQTSKRVVIGVCGLAAVGALLASTSAEACGGLFCDAAIPGPMPVDQTGESVIFVIGGPESEVHIQIAYDPNTNAENFGWLVPLAAVPKFSVGSQIFFDQVRAATVPQYGLSTSFEDCGGEGSFGQSLSDPTTTDPTGQGSTSGAGGESTDGPWQILGMRDRGGALPGSRGMRTSRSLSLARHVLARDRDRNSLLRGGSMCT